MNWNVKIKIVDYKQAHVIGHCYRALIEQHFLNPFIGFHIYSEWCLFHDSNHSMGAVLVMSMESLKQPTTPLQIQHSNHFNSEM